ADEPEQDRHHDRDPGKAQSLEHWPLLALRVGLDVRQLDRPLRGVVGLGDGFAGAVGLVAESTHPPNSLKYVVISDPANGAARSPPRPPRSTRTAIATCGFSAGAKPMNHEWGSPEPPSSAVPDLPAVVTPLTSAPVVNWLPTLPSTAWTIAAVIALASAGEMTRPNDCGAIVRVPCSPALARTRCGRISSPSFAT